MLSDMQYLSFLKYMPSRALQRIDVNTARCGSPHTCPLAQAFNTVVISGAGVVYDNLYDNPFGLLYLSELAQNFLGWWDGDYIRETSSRIEQRRKILKDEIRRILQERNE